jgi:CDP-4-dehydro-6-deoxyglucose reductase
MGDSRGLSCGRGRHSGFLRRRAGRVLAAAFRANVSLAHDCQLGGCGTCRIKLIAGSVSYAEFPLALTEEEANLGYALACQAMPVGDLLLIEPARAELPTIGISRHVAVVSSVRPVSHLVTHLTLEISDIEALDYRPGQYMNVIMPDGTTRSFSMASKPQTNRVDFHIRRIEGGSFTSRVVMRMRPDDRLEVEVPLGSFHLHLRDYRQLLMVATGTGLAPIKAMLESLMYNSECPPVSLYWGSRSTDDLYLHKQIQIWGERLCDFNYVPVLSRADGAWAGRRGYVQDAVTADLGDLAEYAIYLCGSPEMIASAKQTFWAVARRLITSIAKVLLCDVLKWRRHNGHLRSCPPNFCTLWKKSRHESEGITTVAGNLPIDPVRQHHVRGVRYRSDRICGTHVSCHPVPIPDLPCGRSTSQYCTLT